MTRYKVMTNAVNVFFFAVRLLKLVINQPGPILIKT